VMYILSTGCQWRAIPKDLPPRSTVHEYLVRWTRDGTLAIASRAQCEVPRTGCAGASPTAAIIDAQSVKSAEKSGTSIDPRGYDAGKKVKGKKRHVLVDIQGFVLHAIVTAEPPPVRRIAHDELLADRVAAAQRSCRRPSIKVTRRAIEASSAVRRLSGR
jgi:transposase